MKEQIKKMKTELKEMAQQIKNKKPEHKQSQREVSLILPKGHSFWDIWRMKDKYPDVSNALNTSGSKASELFRLRHCFRHKHIAYCMIRGRTIEQIESKNRQDNKPDMKLIIKYIKEVEDATATVGTN